MQNDYEKNERRPISMFIGKIYKNLYTIYVQSTPDLHTDTDMDTNNIKMPADIRLYPP